MHKNLILQCFILLTKKIKPCYVSKLEEGQVLSIANSKFAIGPVNNQIDVRNYFILIFLNIFIICFKIKFHIILYIYYLHVYPVNLNHCYHFTYKCCRHSFGIRFSTYYESWYTIWMYYIGKNKPTEIPITLFHPNGSCLKSQTTMLKRGSSI